MADAAALLATIGGIIFLGYFGSLLFQRTRIPDILILIAAGVVLGPVTHVADTAFFASLTPFFAALALVIMLFDGGINLSFGRVASELGRAVSFTLVGFVAAVALAAGAAIAFGWPLVPALILGAIIGGTSSSAVILLDKMRGDDRAKTVLKLDAAFTDALCVIVTIALIEITLSHAATLTDVGSALVGAFSIAAVVGLAAAVAWFSVLRRIKGAGFDYLLTLAAVFIIYAFVEGVRGNGAVAVLVFGLGLSNAQSISKRLGGKADYCLDDSIPKFHAEVSFFVKTFFLVYLGLLLDYAKLDAMLVAFALILTAAIILARWLAGRASLPGPANSFTRRMAIAVFPRDLAAAVLATLPFSMGVTTASIPQFAALGQLVLLVIILTNAATTVGVVLHERGSINAPGDGAVGNPAGQQAAAKAPKILATRSPAKK